MADEATWKRRFYLYMGARLFGLLTFFAGLAIVFTDLLREGGWPRRRGHHHGAGPGRCDRRPKADQEAVGKGRLSFVKRFWKAATVTREGEGWSIALDGKPVRTPGRELLTVPSEALAAAIADEWNGVGESVEPQAMPLTGLANAAIDRVAPDPEQFARSLARYGESDLACYRAEAPPGLAARQEQAWDSLLAWARRRFDVDFRTTCGIVHVEQPEATVRRLAHSVAAYDPFRLAALSPMVTLGGSLVTALAVAEGAIGAGDAWDAVTIDDRWQLEQWGADAEAEAALEARRRDFLAAARFLELLSG